MSRIKVSTIKITVNKKREPIYRKVRTECCPTCKEPLSYIDALNDGTPCNCGEWWYVMPHPSDGFVSTSNFDDSGWHFEPKPKHQKESS